MPWTHRSPLGPAAAVQAVLSRLRELAPNQFKATQLRTVQREVKAWRTQSARALILNGAGIPTFDYPDTAARGFTNMWEYTYNPGRLYENPPAAPEGSSERRRGGEDKG